MIRPACPDDRTAVLAIDRATHSTHTSPGPGPSAEDEAERFEVDNLLVAEVEGVVRGYVMLGHPTPLESSRHAQMIRGMGVDPAAQGQGMGRKLLREAIVEARHRGARRLTLRVLGHNIPARRLYESEGFVVEGVLVGEFFLDGREVDDIMMAQRLDGGGGDRDGNGHRGSQ